MTTADPLLGATLDRRYRIESRIASGGMATVYLAHDSRLDRRVALKVMRSNLATDPEFVRRFIGEALAVAKLSHSNVVQVFDQGTDGEHVFLAMEYVPGSTLRDLLSQTGRLTARSALEIMVEVLGGLSAAHRAGMVHRDVKPENVLLTADGQVKVADFGLARAVAASQQGLTRTGALMGTAAYLAPEQITNNSADARTDVYAAGVMLYELLTGTQPHRGDSPIAVAYQHVNEDVPRPSTALGVLPVAVDELVARATERDPRYRYADAGELQAAMQRALLSLPGQDSVAALVPGMAPPVSEPAATSDNPTLVTDLTTFEEDESTAPHRVARPRSPAWLIAGVAVLAVTLLGWWLLLGRYETVPSLVGLSEEEALRTGAQAGVIVEVSDDPVFSDVVEVGQVAEVSPAPGERVLPSSTVTVALSQGPRSVEMPDLAGLEQAEAADELTELGFTEIDEEQSESLDQPPGTVIGSDPPAGETANRDDPVVLRVSSGLTVPSVVGLDEDAARERLSENNLTPNITERNDDDTPIGQVIEQDPASGTRAGAGDSVTVVLSAGPEDIDIPDVRGLTEDEAIEELEELGFEVVVERPFQFGNRVIGVDPDGSAPAGTEIVLTVAPFVLGD